ncbi:MULTISPECIES: hypothetical protein [unclassified Clostridium]|uniref:hypothetical protein n=1 Tax=unclassified Clostridium TaxID=2614128 RepID=UPI001177B1EA|nr:MULTISPECIES: hypothetical protein [unclassified Clostridium]
MLTNRKGRYSVVSVAIEYSCGFLKLEVVPTMLASKASFELAYVEQLLIKKYLQLYSKCNTAYYDPCGYKRVPTLSGIDNI